MKSFLVEKDPICGSGVPQVSTELNFSDLMGTVRARLGIARNEYKINPGLYATGTPGLTSDVFVTANYKLSFDHLRKNLSGINGWILVLDTNGVNVWCAAGKGVFSTKELVSKIKDVALDKIVSHRRVILPQLSATGVAAHKVKEETGFNVHYGPVRAGDIKKYLEDGYRADSAMRRVTFNVKDRLKLIPNDFFQGRWYLLGALAVIMLISSINAGISSFKDFLGVSTNSIFNILLAYFSGIVITPALLPYFPARFFSVKGFLAGAIMFLLLFILNLTGDNILEIISWFLLITALSSFIAMNFTGSSTFTSLSGVKKEMKLSIPVQISFAIVGITLQIIGKLI